MIKKIFRLLVIQLLILEASLILKKYKPKLVTIVGSVGKTATKDAIALALGSAFKVRASEKSFNSEIGVPLSILGRPNAWGRPLDWLKTFFYGLHLLVFRKDYPDWLVLELGVDRPGDMERLTTWLSPDIVVLTSLPVLPVHVEFFPSAEALRAEKLLILKNLKPGARVVFNGDDKFIARPEGRITSSYGFGRDNDFKAHDEHWVYHEDGTPEGQTLKLDHAGRTIPFRLPKVFGRSQLYAILAALAVGSSLELNLVTMAEKLVDYEPPVGRLRLLRGIKNSWILDDSYNASPAALTLALETVRALELHGRRIVVLGDMLELGEHTIEAHRQAGFEAVDAADFIFTVGIRAKFIAEAALERGMNQDYLRHFTEAREAGRALQEMLAPNDLVLVKGSQSMRLERVVEEVLAAPEKKTELLCRQEPEWQER